MQDLEWQERSQTTPLLTHIIAGSLAGLSQHLSMIPIDNVKTHCQASSKLTIPQIVNRIYTAGGLANFYSGSAVVAMGCVPAHAIYFTIYEKCKSAFHCQPEDIMKFATIGALSSIFHDLIMTPTETIKQRLQLMRSNSASITTKDVVLNMYRNEGMRSFYRSFPINYAMNVPFGSLIVVINEQLKQLFRVREGDHHLMYYICGAIAGGLSSIPTCPLDVIKTKLNTQDCSTGQCEKQVVCNILKQKVDKRTSNIWEGAPFRSKRGQVFQRERNGMSTRQETVKYRTVVDAAASIWKEDGLLGFFRGVKMRIVIQSLSSGVAWGTYQIAKNFLSPLSSDLQ